MSNWWNDFVGGVESLLGQPQAAFQQVATGQDPFSGFFSDLGSKIAAGIETGFVSFFKDLWDVILGPLEIVVGFLFIAMGLTLMFKDDLSGAIGLMGMVL